MNRKNRTAFWKSAGLAVLLAFAPALIAANPTSAARAQAAAETTSVQPAQISGTVRGYYTNRAGYVTALDLETASGLRQVRFAPSWAKRLLDGNPVGSKLDGWAIIHQQEGYQWSDLVSLGTEQPARFLNGDFHSGAQKLDDASWIWKGSTKTRVEGLLQKVVVNDRGEVLALVLDNGALVRVPRTVRNYEQGAAGTAAVAPLFRNVRVKAWGDREWQADGDVSIYNQHVASDGISINGKTVSATGMPRFSPDGYILSGANGNPIGAQAVEIIGADGEYQLFDPASAANQLPYTTRRPSGIRHIGRAMLQMADGKQFLVVHKGRQLFAIIDGRPVPLHLVNGVYSPPAEISGAKLVMLMDDGRQFDVESSNNRLYVVLPDGNKSPVNL